MAKYKGNSDFKHGTPETLGVLITNLGTPDAPDTPALRRYLGEFLSDPRVIEVPKLIWKCILHGVILRTRPSKSAHAYQVVWTENGSPLMDISLKQLAGINKRLQEKLKGNISVKLAMRYGNPSIDSVLDEFAKESVRRIVVLPLYPQYSATTTASTFDAIADSFKKRRWLPDFRFISHYHDNTQYIDALAKSIQQHWETNGRADKLLFSFHGIPKDYFLAGDPYHCECHKTARLVTEKLGLKEDEWQLTFQSRFGPREWLKPYTDITLQEWGAEGIKSVQVICPGFSADCLETLEEIQIQNRDFFLEAGGESFSYIPCLNDNNEHLDMLSNLIMQHSQGWPETSEDYDEEKVKKELEVSKQQADKLT